MRIGNIVDATETIRPQHSDITHDNTCIHLCCVYYKLTTITDKSQPTYLHLLRQQYQPTRSLQLASHNLMALSGVNASSRMGGDEPPNGLRCGSGTPVLQPNENGLRLSERTATNIGLLYPKVHNNIGGMFSLTSPPTKILVGCVPGGVDASAYIVIRVCQTCVSYCAQRLLASAIF